MAISQKPNAKSKGDRGGGSLDGKPNLEFSPRLHADYGRWETRNLLGFTSFTPLPHPLTKDPPLHSGHFATALILGEMRTQKKQKKMPSIVSG